MRLVWLALAVLAACGDDRVGVPDAALPFLEAGVDSFTGGTLFGETCTQPPFPEIGTCHAGEGACNDEPAGAVCRPWCHAEGISQCAGRQGLEHVTDRGACVCVPPAM